jgi:hypothetical protein
MLQGPFNLTCKINESFKYCTHRRLKKADQDLYKPLQLDALWDPLTITQGKQQKQQNTKRITSQFKKNSLDHYNATMGT